MMKADPDRLDAFLRDYEAYVKAVLQPTQNEISDHLARWQQPDFWQKYKRTNRIPIPTPVQRIFSRIKRPEQVVDKIFRKPGDFAEGLEPASFVRMHDAIGVRILVYFMSHLPLIDRELRSSELLEISEDQPPKAYMSSYQARVLGLDHLRAEEKESGYSSVHYVLRLRHSRVPDTDRPWFEVQVRTLAQELWSTMEHHLGYKPGRRPHLGARRQFKVLSKMIAAIDEHFNVLYEELNRFQEEIDFEDGDALNPENLPPVLAEVGISCAQRDMNNILKFLFSRGVETVRDMRALAQPGRIDVIYHTYLSETGRAPAHLEVLAALAALQGAPPEEGQIRRVVNSQIAYRGSWDSIRHEFTHGSGGEGETS
jgi:putative GTP pyrophosphokinase